MKETIIAPTVIVFLLLKYFLFDHNIFHVLSNSIYDFNKHIYLDND